MTNPISDIGGLANLGGGLMGNSKSGQYAPFQSSGGVTPEQMASAQYDYGQNLLGTQAKFEGEGQGGSGGMSTMATQAATGARLGEAQQLADISQKNTDAQYQAYQQAENINNQNLTNQANQLTGLDKLAGFFGQPQSTTGSTG